MRGRRGGILGAFKERKKGFWWIGEVATYPAWPPGRSQSVVGAALATHSPPSFAIEILKTHLPVFYFDGALSGDWAQPGNWVGGSLPTAGDSVIATASISSNSGGSAATVLNLTINDNFALDIPITVAGIATFNGSSSNQNTITGSATFNDSSFNQGIVTGTATFNDFACNDGGTAGTFVPDLSPPCSAFLQAISGEFLADASGGPLRTIQDS
jgi:hypothetical protein